ncbi:PREDICTED: uncharacterized protein LOC106748259 [Dinoponera quadriceps]|uniref:Uncharacterized protein LOC106748259 n=1 Tax=Dinoponera quadriceps TaxID=609295 RepID=A0A6P3XU99_DINQU|nr:PREDICTED: uncharacterized protein LOC106748259 [Dinoponera quadriceps]
MARAAAPTMVPMTRQDALRSCPSFYGGFRKMAFETLPLYGSLVDGRPANETRGRCRLLATRGDTAFIDAHISDTVIGNSAWPRARRWWMYVDGYLSHGLKTAL